jgi:chemotaxis protein CheD
MVVAEPTSIVVNLGEVTATGDPSTELVCLGIGSCVAVCAYDPETRIGGIAHVVLPSSQGVEAPSPKYADIAIPLLVTKMQEEGAQPSNLVVKIAGGAQMLTLGKTGTGKVGERNGEAVIEVLGKEGIGVAAADLGGNRGRSIRMTISNGTVFVRRVGEEICELN